MSGVSKLFKYCFLRVYGIRFVTTIGRGEWVGVSWAHAKGLAGCVVDEKRMRNILKSRSDCCMLLLMIYLMIIMYCLALGFPCTHSLVSHISYPTTLRF